MVWVCRGSGKFWDTDTLGSGETCSGNLVVCENRRQIGIHGWAVLKVQVSMEKGSNEGDCQSEVPHWGSSTFWPHDWVELHQISSHPHYRVFFPPVLQLKKCTTASFATSRYQPLCRRLTVMLTARKKCLKEPHVLSQSIYWRMNLKLRSSKLINGTCILQVSEALWQK